MALTMIDALKLDEMGFPSVQIVDNQSMTIMKGSTRKEVTRLRELAKDKDGKVDDKHNDAIKASDLEKSHTIKVVWDFSRLVLRNAMKLLASSQSPTVGIQNALRSALIDEQLVSLASGVHPVDMDGKKIDLPGGCTIKSGKLWINLASWYDRPKARTAMSDLDKAEKVASKLDVDELDALIKKLEAQKKERA